MKELSAEEKNTLMAMDHVTTLSEIRHFMERQSSDTAQIKSLLVEIHNHLSHLATDIQASDELNQHRLDQQIPLMAKIGDLMGAVLDHIKGAREQL